VSAVLSAPSRAVGAPRARAGWRRGVAGRFARSRRATGGLLLLLAIVGVVLLAGALAPYDPGEVNPRMRLIEPLGTSRVETFHVFGTDQSGRDMLTRVLYGGRVSLGVAGTAVLLAASTGIVLGLLAGYFGGRLDAAIMRAADVQLAIPTILLGIAIAAALGPSLGNLIVVLAVTGWVIFARTVRASTLTLRELQYVEAARALGAGHARILALHVLRNAWTPIIVLVTQQTALMIILESSLSFLGVGAPVGTPSWGTMVADGRDYVMTNAWWLTAFPGLAISLTVLAINFFGDGLRDVLDPRLRL
jgi:peptide/nickel transport system permease protein